MCKKGHLGYLLILLVALFVLIGCSSLEQSVKGNGVGGIIIVEGEPFDPVQWVTSEEIMAYVLEDDESIYVSEAHEEEVQQRLAANVRGEVWVYKNEKDAEERRKRKLLDLDKYWPKLSIVIWTYVKGYSCEEKPKGFLLPIHNVGDRKKKPVLIYETEEKDKWCIYNKYGSCKVVWKEKKGKFIKLRNGKILKKGGKPVRVEKTVKIMSCM